MGGMNQTRYGAASAATSYHPQSSHQQMGMGYASLPEYQQPSPKQHQTSTTDCNQQQPAAAPRPNYCPRQHLVPTAPQQHQPSAQPMMDSPTLSTSSKQSSEHGSFHYNPYDPQCSRVPDAHQYPQHHQQQQQQKYPQKQQPHFPSQQEYQQYHGQYEEQAAYPQQGYEQQAAYPQEYEEQGQEAPAKSALPYGTLHGRLEGYVSFVPYPTEEFVNPHKQKQVPSEGNMSRVFLGQLPYQVTDMQLDWLCYTFGNGGGVHFPERITKHDPMRGCKVPTGCIHAYADNELVAHMLNSMHKRLLVDDTGVWFAETPQEQAVLNDYCLMMKNDRTKRYQNRPYDTVVAQFATSSFVRRR